MKQIDVDYHKPVLLKESVEFLIKNKDGFYFDGTLGSGGHSSAILEKLSSKGSLISIDQDLDAIKRATKIFKNESRIKIVHTRFSELENLCSNESLDGILLDLGVSSHQFDQPYRGFSYKHGKSPLDMRMNQESKINAVDYIESHTQREIAQSFFSNSDISFPLGRKIGRVLKEKIVFNQTVSVIKEALQEIYPLGIYNQSKILSQVFQAIRIEVNQEKKEVEKNLKSAVEKLVVGGRICVITFHSVEDRWVKHLFKKYENDCICPSEYPICQCGGKQQRLKKIIKKPLIPRALEVQSNSRSRSAKLRVMKKIR